MLPYVGLQEQPGVWATRAIDPVLLQRRAIRSQLQLRGLWGFVAIALEDSRTQG